MKYDIVVVQYYASDTALARCLGQFGRMLGGVGVAAEFHKVDIRAPVPEVSGREGYPFLDISGYREGLRQVPPGAPAIVLNDTFFTKHPWRSYTQSLAGVLRILAKTPAPCSAGAVFPTQSVLLRDDRNPSRRHLCTFLVAMNGPGRQVMEQLFSELPDAEEPAVQSWLQTMRSDHPALDALMGLHFAEEPNPWRWPGMAGQPSTRLVQRKAVSVAFEYLFSCRLLEGRGLILPINAGTRQWLAEQIERLWVRGRSLVVSAPR